VVDFTGSKGLKRSRRSRRSNWLPYEASRRLQFDALLGLVMIFLAAIGLLIAGAFGDSFSVSFVDGQPVASDGRDCVLLQSSPVDDPGAPARAMVDCGDEGGFGASAMVQHVLIAVGAVGVLLLLSAVFSLVLASRMPRETLAVPFCVVAILIGLVAVLWGLGDSGGPALVFQGDRERAFTGILRSGGRLTTHEGAVSAGVGLISASIVRLTRP
jgi:hypothetical protein